MKYSVLVRNGWYTKCVTCRNLDEACGYAHWPAFLLDIKVKETLPKKDWTKWDNDTCFFEYDITSDNYKDNAFTFIRIKSQHLPMPLYGKSVTQIEKHLNLKSNDKNH